MRIGKKMMIDENNWETLMPRWELEEKFPKAKWADISREEIPVGMLGTILDIHGNHFLVNFEGYGLSVIYSN